MLLHEAHIGTFISGLTNKPNVYDNELTMEVYEANHLLSL